MNKINIADFFKGIWEDNSGNYIDIITGKSSKELKTKALAINHAVDLIAKTISKSEIKVYRYNQKNKKIEPTIDQVYYKLNVRPNPNEDGSTFFYNVITKMLLDQEALIIRLRSTDGMFDLFLADSFEYSEDITKPKTFKNIILKDKNGNKLSIKKEANADDAIYLSLGNSEIKKCIDDFYTEYAKLLNSAAVAFKKSNTSKYRLKIPGEQPTMKDPITGDPITYESFKKKVTEGLLENDEEAIVMLSENFDLSKIDTGEVKTSEDYRDMVKDVLNYIAMMFDIPLDVYYGSKTDKSTGTNDFITFAVGPNLEILEDGLNGKLISQKDYINGERIKINKFNMKHFDIMDVAGSLDKLTAIGFSHNDIEEFLGIPLTNEDWAKEHYFTKNYSNVKGGENNGKK